MGEMGGRECDIWGIWGFIHLVGEERAQRRVERRHVERDERAPLVGAPLGAAVAVDELFADQIKVNQRQQYKTTGKTYTIDFNLSCSQIKLKSIVQNHWGKIYY